FTCLRVEGRGIPLSYSTLTYSGHAHDLLISGGPLARNTKTGNRILWLRHKAIKRIRHLFTLVLALVAQQRQELRVGLVQRGHLLSYCFECGFSSYSEFPFSVEVFA